MSTGTDPIADELAPQILGWWTTPRGELYFLLGDLLDDGSGQVRDELQRLWMDLTSMPRPDRGLMWIRNNPHVSDYLRGLALGTIPLTHEGLHQLPSWRTAAHLRDLLMASGALPQIDRQIALFERWSRQRLLDIPDPEHARLLRQFTTWRLLPTLHARAARGPLSPGSRNTAAGYFNTAARFLDWLADGHGHQPGHHLAQTTQTDLDAWAARRPAAEGHRLHTFLKWAMAGGHMPRLAIPPTQRTQRPPISQHQRLAMLRRFLTDLDIPLRTRVAACLLLLYAQPIVRLVRPDHRRHLQPRGRDPPAPGHPGQPGPRTLRRDAARAGQQPGEHEHRHQPRLPLAVPRRPRRPTTGAPPRFRIGDPIRSRPERRVVNAGEKAKVHCGVQG